MKVIFEKAKEIGDGLWEAKILPTDVQRLGGRPITHGARSVILVENALHDATASTLSVDIDDIIPVVVGTGDRGLALVVQPPEPITEEKKEPSADDNEQFDDKRFPGDTEYLQELSRLPADAKIAARRLLANIRRRNPGSMKRGARRNFSNQPDNFWYAIVQPVKGNVSITVRGTPDLFEPSTLELKPDRPGYTRFYLTNPSEVNEAYRIIESSKRRK